MAGKRASHLVRSLRALARDPKASANVRLKACELLWSIETTMRRLAEASAPKSRESKEFDNIMRKMVGARPLEESPDTPNGHA